MSNEYQFTKPFKEAIYYLNSIMLQGKDLIDQFC